MITIQPVVFHVTYRSVCPIGALSFLWFFFQQAQFQNGRPILPPQYKLRSPGLICENRQFLKQVSGCHWSFANPCIAP
jgi:hypothetical protein